MLRRIGLFLITNLAIIIVISAILSIFHVQPYLSAAGINYQNLLAYALIIGFTGSFISLFLSKFMAKMAFNISVIEKPANETETWLYATIQRLAQKVNIKMPEVGIYHSEEPNAFATGPSRNNALVAVSTGLLQNMDRDEVEAVLGHEISHVANGDMVTLTLIQGVVNTFVIFFARVIAYVVMQFFRRNEEHGGSAAGGFAYYGLVILFEILFGILASIIVMYFSRYREYRADAGSARLLGKQKMIEALQVLQRFQHASVEEKQSPAFNTMKINNTHKLLNLFASHPPIEDRIKALREMRGI